MIGILSSGLRPGGQRDGIFVLCAGQVGELAAGKSLINRINLSSANIMPSSPRCSSSCRPFRQCVDDDVVGLEAAGRPPQTGVKVSPDYTCTSYL